MSGNLQDSHVVFAVLSVILMLSNCIRFSFLLLLCCCFLLLVFDLLFLPIGVDVGMGVGGVGRLMGRLLLHVNFAWRKQVTLFAKTSRILSEESALNMCNIT